MIAGYELNLSGWCRNKELLNNKDRLMGLLNSICYKIKMRALDFCNVHVEEDLKRLGREPFADEGGASAVLILSTSHIAIHGWPNRDRSREDGGYFWLNVCSCRDFDPKVVEEIINESLWATHVNKTFLHVF